MSEANKKNILFISAVCPPSKNVTSTDIMINNIIEGISMCGHNIVLAAVCKTGDDEKAIKEYYSKFVKEIIILPSNFKKKMTPIEYTISLFKNSYFHSFYRRNSKILLNVKSDIVISNNVYFDEICYGKELKKLKPKQEYYQLWTDPMALSGVTPEIFKKRIKRWPFYIVEKKALKGEAKIIYSTKSLMIFQKNMYPEMAKNMYYVDAGYIPDSESATNFEVNNKIIYAGNFYKNIRNIEPLVEAIGELDGYELDIYGSGNCDVIIPENVKIHPRVSLDELKTKENEFFYSVCILNHSCIQIPGKVFYNIQKNNAVIIVADGPYRDVLIEYLKEYKRFIVCENNKESIKRAIISSKDFSFDKEYIETMYSPKKIATDIVNGGL